VTGCRPNSDIEELPHSLIDQAQEAEKHQAEDNPLGGFQELLLAAHKGHEGLADGAKGKRGASLPPLIA
jgi:hypothetical protein